MSLSGNLEATNLPADCGAYPTPDLTGARAGLRAMPDDALVARTRAGDTAAFEVLLGRHELDLLRLAFRFVRNHEDAQEVVQDVFLTTWRKLPGFEARSQFGSWLYRVAVNASLMHLRARKSRPVFVGMGTWAQSTAAAYPDLESNAPTDLQPDEQMEAVELQQAIENAVGRLPRQLHSVFIMREVEGWSTRKVGESLGLSEATVKTRLHRARRILREAIAGHAVQ